MEYGHFKEENFSKRHIGLNEVDKGKLLKKLGYGTMDKFINDVVPQNIKRSAPMKIEKELSEKQLLSKIKEYASLNKTMISMIGQGFYSTHTPSVLLRNILENPSWYTAYTPYQPEISQGRLEALLNFQTMISEITSLPIANASMLDESTAAAEAMTMSFKLTNNKNTVILDKYLHPQTINVIKTRAEPLGINLIISENPEKEKLDDCSCVIFQYPNTEGKIKNLDNDIKIIQSAGSMVILVADLLSLALIKYPGEMGADIAVGSTQRFGVPMAFGGPHAGYFATKEKFSRKMPGRLVGVSQDKTGLKAYRLALQTREQHIRREKATSNICTAQALLAIMAGFYGVWHGPNGLKNIAMKVNQYASKFANLALEAAGTSTEITTSWANETFDKFRVSAKAKDEPLDYGKAMVDFWSAQTEITSKKMELFSDVLKKAQMETLELMVSAGKDMTKDASEIFKKKAVKDITSASKKMATG